MISVRVPREIDEYKEKILFGLSLRQLAGGLIAAVLAIGSYLLCTKVAGLSSDIASYAVIFLAAPPLAIGFVKVKGMYFEEYVKQFYEWRKTDNRKILIYEYQEFQEEEKPNTKKKSKGLAKRKREELNEAVYTDPDFSKKAIRRNWEDAKRYIKET